MLRYLELSRRTIRNTPRLYSHLAQVSPRKTNNKSKYCPGDTLHGFIVEEVETINELYLDVVRLTHKTTGAQYLHLDRDDSNNVFAIGFRTTPMDSTGVPHILEHTVLSGSKRYPVRDLFTKMLNRSLATYINALTAPDYTVYPFATQNLKDFRNLQSVYSDAVFQPLLNKGDFSQEGWRLEHSNVDDNKSPIIIKGVVFNEMKGVFNDNQMIFAEKFQNSILPSHTYGICSGGLPLVIPELTHESLKKFHNTYYHPSNSKIFSYGNFPFEDNLKFMNEEYLSASERIDTNVSLVPPEKRWTSPRVHHVTCRHDPLATDVERQGTIAIGHLCNDINDTQTSLEMNILVELLLKGPTTAFHKSFIESKLATGFGMYNGFDSMFKDTVFAVSLQGVEPKNFDKIQEIYDSTLDRVIDEGFEQDHIEAILHNIEMRIKHQTSDFGLQMLHSVTPTWMHNGDIVRTLKINQALDSFVTKIKDDSKYLSKLIEKYLRYNTHRLTLTMSPDENYDRELIAKEKKLLEKKLANCDVNTIFDAGQKLRADLMMSEDLSILPTLKVADIKPDVDRYVYDDVKVEGVPLQISVQPTNNVFYFRGILNTSGIDFDLKPLISIFNNVITEMGTKKHDYREFDRLCQLKTAGLSFLSHVRENKDCLNSYEEGILISSYCLDRNIDDMWKLWIELFNEVELDDMKRFKILVRNFAIQMSNRVADCGHLYAMSSASSLVSSASKFEESISGLEFIGKLKEITQEKNFPLLLENIQRLRHQVLNKTYFKSAINFSDGNESNAIEGLQKFYESIEGKCNSEKILYTTQQINNPSESGFHYVMPYATNYTAKAISTVPYSDPDYAPLKVLAKLISFKYLIPEIREKEGAYGSGAMISHGGVFTFFSFRDPNSTKTLDTFDKTWKFLQNYEFEQRDLDEAKLGVFQKLDAPTSPCSRGMLRFTHGLSDDDIQFLRIQLQKVSIDDVLRVAQKYLNPEAGSFRVGRAIIGPSNTDLLERKHQNWNVRTSENEAI